VKHQCDSTRLQGVTSQKTAIVATAFRTLNLTCYQLFELVAGRQSWVWQMRTGIWNTLTCFLWFWGTRSIAIYAPGSSFVEARWLCWHSISKVLRFVLSAELLNTWADSFTKYRKQLKARGALVPSLIYAILFCLTVAEVPKECKEWKQSTGWMSSQQPAWSEDAFQIRGEGSTSRTNQTLHSSSHRCFVCWNTLLFSFSFLVAVFTCCTDCLFVLSG